MSKQHRKKEFLNAMANGRTLAHGMIEHLGNTRLAATIFT
jgi:hypothetical protein